MARTWGSGISPVQQEYLDILRAAIWGQVPARMPGDVKGVLEIADLQKTRPLVLDALQKAGLEDIDPGAWDVIYRTASAHITLNQSIANLVSFFRKSGIDPILLKGQAVALNYPEPMLRECGDIDFYIGESSYEKSCQLLKSLAKESDLGTEKIDKKHYHLSLSGVQVELHKYCETSPVRRENTYIQKIASRGLHQDLVPVTIEGVSVNTPADSFNAFYIFYHIWHHFTLEGVGLRQVCDWALFLHNRAGRLDTSVIEKAVEKLRLQVPWQVFAHIAVDYLGLPKAEMPLYEAGYEKRTTDCLSLIFEEGNFGRGNPGLEGRPSGNIAGKWFTTKMLLQRPKTLFRIFPEIRPLAVLLMINVLKEGISRNTKEFFQK